VLSNQPSYISAVFPMTVFPCHYISSKLARQSTQSPGQSRSCCCRILVRLKQQANSTEIKLHTVTYLSLCITTPRTLGENRKALCTQTRVYIFYHLVFTTVVSSPQQVNQQQKLNPSSTQPTTATRIIYFFLLPAPPAVWRKKAMSPSLTSYSLPRCMSLPAFLTSASEPYLIRSS